MGQSWGSRQAVVSGSSVGHQAVYQAVIRQLSKVSQYSLCSSKIIPDVQSLRSLEKHCLALFSLRLQLFANPNVFVVYYPIQDLYALTLLTLHKQAHTEFIFVVSRAI